MGMKTNANWLVATTGVLCYCFAGSAMSQAPGSVITPVATPSGQNIPGAATVPNLGTQSESASDEPTTAPAWTIVPRIGLTGTLTDNINLASTDKQSGLISQLSPGIRIDGRTARLKMFVDYQLDAIAYSTSSLRAIYTTPEIPQKPRPFFSLPLSKASWAARRTTFCATTLRSPIARTVRFPTSRFPSGWGKSKETRDSRTSIGPSMAANKIPITAKSGCCQSKIIMIVESVAC
jgi:hypothetical protein